MCLAAVADIGVSFEAGKARSTSLISATSQRGLNISRPLYISSAVLATLAHPPAKHYRYTKHKNTTRLFPLCIGHYLFPFNTVRSSILLLSPRATHKSPPSVMREINTLSYLLYASDEAAPIIFKCGLRAPDSTPYSAFLFNFYIINRPFSVWPARGRPLMPKSQRNTEQIIKLEFT